MDPDFQGRKATLGLLGEAAQPWAPKSQILIQIWIYLLQISRSELWLPFQAAQVGIDFSLALSSGLKLNEMEVLLCNYSGWFEFEQKRNPVTSEEIN